MSTVPNREFCGMCHDIIRVGFKVPNEIWKEVIKPYYQESPICLRCFTRRADEKLIPWDLKIKLFPTSYYTLLVKTREFKVAPPGFREHELIEMDIG